MPAHRLPFLFDDPPAAEAAPGLWIPLVLEDGDSADLRRLFDVYGRERIERWLAARGGRQLSRRSRLFWAAVLDCETSSPAAEAEALWPL